jgi:hypothetical protein
MTEQPEPIKGKSSPIDATIDPAPAAPGPLFADKIGEPDSVHTDSANEQLSVPGAAPAVDRVPAAAPEKLSLDKSAHLGEVTDARRADQAPLREGVGLVSDPAPATVSMGEVPVRPFVALAERPKAVLGSGPAAVFPVPMEPTRAALGTDVVTCPECGQLATVDMARRQADDFCRRCDFPLFWARGTVIAPDGTESGASLRRLPGTVGRAATAALICPHCSEPNAPSAEICIRCALSLHPVDIPEPAPVVIAPPEPEPEPEPLPEKSFDWWWIVAIAAAVIAAALIVGLLYLR